MSDRTTRLEIQATPCQSVILVGNIGAIFFLLFAMLEYHYAALPSAIIMLCAGGVSALCSFMVCKAWLGVHGFVSIFLGMILVLIGLEFQVGSADHNVVLLGVFPLLCYFLLDMRSGHNYTAAFLIGAAIVCMLAINSGDIMNAYSHIEVMSVYFGFLLFSSAAFLIARNKKQQAVLLHSTRQELQQKYDAMAVHHAITTALLHSSYEQGLSDALQVMLDHFQCSRVWLCRVLDSKRVWHVPFEATVPMYPGAFEAKDYVAMDAELLKVFEQLSYTEAFVRIGSMNILGDPEVLINRYAVQSEMMLRLHVPNDAFWCFGVHQCDRERQWSKAEQLQLLEFANHIQAVLSQKILYEELRLKADHANHASDAKSTFLATMSHELRTPLHGIIGMQSMLAKGAHYLSDEHKQLLDLAQHSSHVLSSLIDDVLDLSKIEAGKIELEQKQFDLYQCLQDALYPFLMLAYEKKIELTLQCVQIPVLITGDEKRLRQVLLNLLGNALKFTDVGGCVELHAHYNEGDLYLAVIDNGIGIPADQLDALFKPFVQLSESPERKGTGLGTTIAQKFVTMMYGHLSVTSEVGKGSRFEVELPLTEVAPKYVSHQINMQDMRVLFKQLDGADIDGETGEGLESLRVLLAEDDPIGRRIAVESLKPHGCIVDEAEHGLQAWEMFQQQHYDVLLTDIRMPGLNGIELTQRIRQFERGAAEGAVQGSSRPHLCIIGLSAHVLEEVAEQCLLAGMDDFISKPVNPDTIIQRMAQIKT